MSASSQLITTCPACLRAFEASRVALAEAGGWLRCGPCGEVFDGNARMTPVWPASMASPVRAEPGLGAENPKAGGANGSDAIDSTGSAVFEPPAGQGMEAIDRDVLDLLGSAFADAALAPAGELAKPAAVGGAPAVEGHGAALEAEGASREANFERGLLAVEASILVGEGAAEPRSDLEPGDAPSETELPERAGSTAPPTATWEGESFGAFKSPERRAGKALLCLALAASLGAQAAWANSSALAARWPAHSALVASVCSQLGCSAKPPQERLAVDLEEPEVLLDDQGRLRFFATLRNKAGGVSEAPRLWLAIEGEGGEALAARTFEPSEWLGASTLAAGAEREVKLTFPAMDRPTAGFKARLEWPAPR